jgi:DNA-directed RNA polymerase specialized sigma subunit
MYEYIDIAIADELGVSVEEYIEKIESISEKRAEVIISAVWGEDQKKLEKAKRIFKNIIVS